MYRCDLRLYLGNSSIPHSSIFISFFLFSSSFFFVPRGLGNKQLINHTDAIMDLPGLDETGFMIDSCIRAETANQDDFQKFVSQYLGQIIKGLRLPWSVTSKDKMMDEGTRYSREVFVTASGITVLWGEISHSKTIDQMRLDLVARARLQATHTNRHFAFAFASSNKDQYVEIECLRIDPDSTYRTMGNRTLNFNDQGEIIDFFFGMLL